jgi:hypothetical protein
MTSLTPVPGWDAVPELETSTSALAGPGGPMNTQAQALLDRTEQMNPDNLDAPASYTGNETFAMKVGGAWVQGNTKALGTYISQEGGGGNTSPVTITGGSYTVAASDTSLLMNGGTTQTITLPAASAIPGRVITVRNLSATRVVSNAANVKYASGTTNLILPPTVGSWVALHSDGTNWIAVSDSADRFVTPQMFGAVGDGVTDDTASMQAWLNSLTSGARGECKPSSVYAVKNLQLPTTNSYTTESGYGPVGFSYAIYGNGSTIKLLSGAADATYGIAAANWVSNITEPNSPIYIKDLNIDANGQATYAAFVSMHYNSKFENLNVFDAAGSNFIQSGMTKNGTAAQSATYTYGPILSNNTWISCQFLFGGGYGFKVAMPSNPPQPSNQAGVMVGCQAFENALANVSIDQALDWQLEFAVWNQTVTQTDTGLSVIGNADHTRFLSCEFGNAQTSNTAVALNILNAGVQAASFDDCLAFGEVQLGGSGVTYTMSGTTAQASIVVMQPGTRLLSSAGMLWAATPFVAKVGSATNPSIVISTNDFWGAQNVRLNGQHRFNDESGNLLASPGGLSYLPLVSNVYNTLTTASHTLSYADALNQYWNGVIPQAINWTLPKKATVSDWQATYYFERDNTSGNTDSGSYAITVLDQDTGNPVAVLQVPGEAVQIDFDGAQWHVIDAGSGEDIVAAKDKFTAGALFTASISGTTMTVTALTSGTIIAGQTLYGNGVGTGITIVAPVSVNAQGIGTWTVSVSQSLASGTMGSATATQFAPTLTTQLTVAHTYASSVGTLIYFDGELQTDISLFGDVINLAPSIPVGVQVVTVIGASTAQSGGDNSSLADFANTFAAWFATLPTTLPAVAGTFWNDGKTLAQA